MKRRQSNHWWWVIVFLCFSVLSTFPLDLSLFSDESKLIVVMMRQRTIVVVLKLKPRRTEKWDRPVSSSVMPNDVTNVKIFKVTNWMLNSLVTLTCLWWEKMLLLIIRQHVPFSPNSFQRQHQNVDSLLIWRILRIHNLPKLPFLTFKIGQNDSYWSLKLSM